MPAHLRQLSLQAAAALLVISLAWPFHYLRASDWNWGLLALAIGATAFAMARLARQAWWWQLIHLGFAPLLWAGMQVELSPLWHLGFFLLLFFTFRGAASGQIPLYLGKPQDAEQLARWLPQQASLLDIGAGVGSVLLPLRQMRPDLRLAGIENAPLPWVIGWLRCRGCGIAWHWGDFWQHALAPYDAVYCFLSPVPMQALWHKACAEMAPGSLFLSKAFPVPDIACETILENTAGTGWKLYVYRIPDHAAP